MHPQVMQDKAGVCPVCGIDLEPVDKQPHKHTGQHEHGDEYDKHKGHHASDFLKRFWVCMAVTIPVLLLSHMVQMWLGIQLSFPGDKFILLGLATFTYLYGGRPFLKGMIREIKAKATGMMTLIAIAISVAYTYSAAVVFGLKGTDFFWELATLIDIMLLGHWLDMRSQMSASRALQSLIALLPNDVTVNRNGSAVQIKLDELKNGDIVIIRPGEKIPADGIITEGSSYINESLLTGESAPVKKEVNTHVIAGSINGDGALTIKASGVGKDTYLHKVIKLVQDAQATKSNTQNLADKVARWLTFIAIGVGITTFAFWYISSDDLSFALERMVTVMVTACPHALGVAIPLVVAISTTLSATNGLLIRNRTAFETSRRLSTVIFDKTGTLTEGAHAVEKIIPLTDNFTETDIIQYAAAVQQHSEHHIAKGIIKYLEAKKLDLWQSQEFGYIQGVGVKGQVNGRQVVAAGPNYFKKNNLVLPEIPQDINQDRQTVSFVLINHKVVGIIALADKLRESAQQAIQDLKKMNIRPFLLTGDNEKVAAAVAATLQIDAYAANVLPHQKQEKVKELQAKGAIVAMTGDGVNDAPALALADVGIAIGSGTDVAAETADIILVNSDPRDVAILISFAKHTYAKMIQNISWAVGYNVIAIPLAAGVLYPEFVLSPAIGAVLMSASTIIVAINASLLKLKSH